VTQIKGADHAWWEALDWVPCEDAGTEDRPRLKEARLREDEQECMTRRDLAAQLRAMIHEHGHTPQVHRALYVQIAGMRGECVTRVGYLQLVEIWWHVLDSLVCGPWARGYAQPLREVRTAMARFETTFGGAPCEFAFDAECLGTPIDPPKRPVVEPEVVPEGLEDALTEAADANGWPGNEHGEVWLCALLTVSAARGINASEAEISYYARKQNNNVRLVFLAAMKKAANEGIEMDALPMPWHYQRWRREIEAYPQHLTESERCLWLSEKINNISKRFARHKGDVYKRARLKKMSEEDLWGLLKASRHQYFGDIGTWREC